MKKIFSLAILLSLFFIALSTQDLRAATYYVSQSGSGNGSGSSYANRMSVSRHNSGTFSPGDMIYLCDTITFPIKVPSSGAEGYVITYRGNYSGHAANLDMSYEVMAIQTGGQDYLTFDNIEISDGLEGIGNYSSGRVSDNITVTNCTIHNIANRGILGTDWKNVTIGGSAGNGNTIYDCGGGTAGGDANFLRASYVTISHNQLYGDGVSTGVDGIGMEACDNMTIEYNKIYDHYREDGIDIKKNSHDIIIRYNHIYGHPNQSGITIQMGSYDVKIYGNSIYDNNWAGILIKKGNSGTHDITGIEIWANLIYSNASGVTISSSGTADIDIRGVKIYNKNVLAENGNVSGTVQHTGVYINVGTGHEVKNNIFYKNTGEFGKGDTYQQVEIAPGVTATFDYNIYHFPWSADKDMFEVTGTKYSLTEWKALSQDANSTWEKGSFVYKQSPDAPSRPLGLMIQQSSN